MGSILLAIAIVLGALAEPPPDPVDSHAWRRLNATFEGERIILACEIEPAKPVELWLSTMGWESFLYDDALDGLNLRESLLQRSVFETVKVDGTGYPQSFRISDRGKEDIFRRATQGVLACDFLRQGVLRLDYEAQAAFVSSFSPRKEPGVARIAAVRDHRQWRIPVKVAGKDGEQLELQAIVAIEGPQPLLVTEQGLKKLSRVEGDFSPLASLEMGGFTLHEVPIDQTPGGMEHWTEGADLVIGHRVLEQFTLTLDGDGPPAVHLRPNAYFGRNCKRAYLGCSTSVRLLSVADDECFWRITGVFADSPAALAGFAKDDCLIGIEGLSGSRWSPASMEDLWWRNVGKPIAVTVMRGDTQKVLSITPIQKPE